ncbi:MAG: hydrogenase expression/formation protein HypE [Candidatus Omnitrophica bacterium]|nr:hydrogenase expression/formation protein HypE [Candidatus Omnitrophota bacterium]
MMDVITLSHGSGGKLSHKLINDVFYKHFKNDILALSDDAARLPEIKGELAFTTDSFVVTPIFFPGGDIGKIAIAGTVNDLAVSGAKPMYISCAAIIEEGFLIKDLERIVISMAECALEAGVKIVCGDTKIVEKNAADGIFINTSGVGMIKKDYPLGYDKIKTKDKIILTGTSGDHGIAIMSKRKGFEFDSEIKSDSAPLNIMIQDIMDNFTGVKFMRDPTRGGVATTLNEIAKSSGKTITIVEDQIPVKEIVKAASELLGLDILYLANEGKALIFVDEKIASDVVNFMSKYKYGKDAAVIGEVTDQNDARVYLKTRYGSSRILDMLTGEQLPRIC